MKINVKNSMFVRPAEETPSVVLWNASVDLTFSIPHVPILHFYCRPTSINAKAFFNAKLMKAALGRALVPFYPLAGRLKKDKNGRLEIDCNAEGVLFVEAESPDAVVDDFVDFSQTLELVRLVPTMDYSKGISSFPLLGLQLTHFKCGGVCLGVGIQHQIADGYSLYHFLQTWSNMARGLDITLLPSIDRTLLQAHNPPQPRYEHIEYYPPPTLSANSNPQQNSTKVAVKMFKLNKDQINALKEKSKVEGNMSPTYSSFVILTSHIWRSSSKARGLSQDQKTKLYIGVDGRVRFQPTLPPGYFGSPVFWASPIARSGDIESKPLGYSASIIQLSLSRVDNNYLRSALDYLESPSVLNAIVRGADKYKCPNLGVLSWTRLSIYDVDFGWGRPIHVGPAGIGIEGLCYVLPNPTNDQGLSIMISLQAEHMKHFEKVFYDF